MLILENLPSIDPFSNSAPMVNERDDQLEKMVLLTLCRVTEEECQGFSGAVKLSDCIDHHSDWEEDIESDSYIVLRRQNY